MKVEKAALTSGDGFSKRVSSNLKMRCQLLRVGGEKIGGYNLLVTVGKDLWDAMDRIA